ncbi:Hypothetical protein NGAL_HAMBI490_56130 [Neorhizobium galegae bv. officinalis]|nr:Hypothetical protein NGAL_HAMBI490_56130 [Neorhizobium galegae bv. officinalis]
MRAFRTVNRPKHIMNKFAIWLRRSDIDEEASRSAICTRSTARL